MKSLNKVYIGSDHAGFELKQFIITHYNSMIDIGCYSAEAVDYPDIANLLCSKMKVGDAGILICGTGIGMSIAANRRRNIRAALCHNVECTKLSREHNDANVLVLGARMLDKQEVLEMVNIFFNTAFAKGRHANRVKKL